MKRITTVLLLMMASAAMAEVMDRPQGFKIGERLTLRPYVSLEYVYDSNHDGNKHGEAISQWAVNPGINARYLADNWAIDAGAYYRYAAYNKYSKNLNANNYGENIRAFWTDSTPTEKGWTLVFTEKYDKCNDDDDMTKTNGRGLWRDRQTFQTSGVVERRFNDKLHANFNADYYYLDYDNNMEKYMNLYGWRRMTVGGEGGYALSEWTDLIVGGSYMWYRQDNSQDREGYSSWYPNSPHISNRSEGYVVQGGIASRATERISYRALLGWSHFEYGSTGSRDDNVSYSASMNWKMSDTWNMMFLANRYYQPSERQYGTAMLVDAISWGLGHSMVRGKLNATLDLAYRHEDRTYNVPGSFAYDEDFFSARLGLNYIINRFFTAYARAEYQMVKFDGDTGGNADRDYDRFRGTIGLRLTY